MDTQNKIEFITLYEPVHNQLSKFCRAISGNSEDGEDLLQDTILNSLEGFNKIKDKKESISVRIGLGALSRFLDIRILMIGALVPDIIDKPLSCRR